MTSMQHLHEPRTPANHFCPCFPGGNAFHRFPCGWPTGLAEALGQRVGAKGRLGGYFELISDSSATCSCLPGPNSNSRNADLAPCGGVLGALVQPSLQARPPGGALMPIVRQGSEAVNVDRRDVVGRGVKDVAVVVGPDELGPVGGRATGGGNRRRFYRCAPTAWGSSGSPWGVGGGGLSSPTPPKQPPLAPEETVCATGE